GNIAGHGADAGDVDCDGGGAAVTRDVANGDAVGIEEPCLDDAADGVDAAGPVARAAHMGERDDEADGPVAAHIEVADVVEEDDAGIAGRVGGLAEEG